MQLPLILLVLLILTEVYAPPPSHTKQKSFRENIRNNISNIPSESGSIVEDLHSRSTPRSRSKSRSNASNSAGHRVSFLLAVLGVRPERWSNVKRQIHHLKRTTSNTVIDFHCSVSFFDLEFYETLVLGNSSSGALAEENLDGCTYVLVPGLYTHQLVGVRNVASYDYVGALLDDVNVMPMNSSLDFRIPYFLRVMQKFQFDVASPAMVNYHIKDKVHMQPHPHCLARETRILDHLFDVFTKAAYLCLQAQVASFVDTNYYGWAYVPMMHQTCNCKCGVIDQQYVEHMLPKIQNTKKASKQKFEYLKFIFRNNKIAVTKESVAAYHHRLHKLEQMGSNNSCKGVTNIPDDSYRRLPMTKEEYHLHRTTYGKPAHKSGFRFQ